MEPCIAALGSISRNTNKGVKRNKRATPLFFDLFKRRIYGLLSLSEPPQALYEPLNHV